MTREQLEALAPPRARANGQAHRRRMLDRVENYLYVHGPAISAAQAAARLGVTARTVQRYRAFLRGLDVAP